MAECKNRVEKTTDSILKHDECVMLVSAKLFNDMQELASRISTDEWEAALTVMGVTPGQWDVVVSPQLPFTTWEHPEDCEVCGGCS